MSKQLDASKVLRRLRDYHANEVSKISAAIDTDPHPSISAGLLAQSLEHEQYLAVVDGILGGMKTATQTKEKSNG